MAFTNLPGIFENKLDGNLAILETNGAPVVLVIGTASKGDSETFYRVNKVSDAVSAFGKTGTLVRGLYEASIAGALNLRLFRIGATAAKLENIGSTPGLTIETIAKDNSAGADYKLFYDDTTQRLRVYRTSDDEVVYDNYPAYPLSAIDLGEVSVTGTTAGGGGDIGTLGTPVSLEDAEFGYSSTYTAGTDGVDLSRMELYEALYDGYELLEDQDIDVVVPMNVYLDDLNVMDMAAATVTSLGLSALSVYPDAGTSTDALGKLYVEEYQGKNYFWWWFPSNPSANADTTFTNDSGANIFPSAGSASATLKTDGSALTGSDFHEVNFAYQLATFCYQQGNQHQDMTGAIGVLPPTSFSLKNVSTWVGTLPVTTVDGSGNVVVSTNGTGLLGNKFMSGRITSGGIVGHTVNGVEGLYNGGFVATDDGWLDGAQLLDANDHIIDIGKYISVVSAYPILSNPSRSTSYSATGAATYAGFYSGLPADSAPSNKILSSVRLPFRLNTSKLDLLAGQRFVMFHSKPKGIVVSDAPTAARPDSDYRRLSTIRIVKAVVDGIREVAEPFLGEGMSGARLAALEGAIDRRLQQFQKFGTITRFKAQLTSLPSDRVQGKATLELQLAPAFEMRQLTITVALAAV